MDEKKQQEMEHIDTLVLSYQAGDDEAGEEVLRLFGCHPEQEHLTRLVGKYYSLLRYGRMDLNDKDTRRFISCFISDPVIRKKMIPFYQYAETQKEVRKTVQKINDQCRAIEDEDLIQDLRFLFIRQMKRWKKRKKSDHFQGYIYKSYRYAVKNHLKNTFRANDPFMHHPHRVGGLEEDLVNDPNALIEINDRLFEETYLLDLDDEIGNSWVRGITCGDEFKSLTNLQRLIIKLYYQDGYTDGQIAKRMNMHINTIFKHRKRAKEIIEETERQLREDDEA